MDVTAEQKGDAFVVTVNAARIDAAAAIQFKDRLREVMPAGVERVILDLGAVDFIDSSGLGAVVSVRKQMAAAQRMELAALQPNVDRVFRLTRMDTVFTIHDDLAAAVGHHAG